MRIRGKDKVPGLLAQAADLLIDPETWSGPPGSKANDRSDTDPDSQCAHHFMEVGCGRGTFVCTLAARKPQDEFIAVDKYTPIVARAAALAVARNLTNIQFFDGDLEQLQPIVPPRSLDGIYLNFPDPWPRRRNERKRLTHGRFLEIYQSWLKQGGFLEFKTDNEVLFDWSARSLQSSGWHMVREERGLPGSPPPERAAEAAFIQTEYEAKFRAQNLAIYHLRAIPRA